MYYFWTCPSIDREGCLDVSCKMFPNAHCFVPHYDVDAILIVRSLPLEDRKCRFSDEIPEDYMAGGVKVYDEFTCRFGRKMSDSSLKCGCALW